MEIYWTDNFFKHTQGSSATYLKVCLVPHIRSSHGLGTGDLGALICVTWTISGFKFLVNLFLTIFKFKKKSLFDSEDEA